MRVPFRPWNPHPYFPSCPPMSPDVPRCPPMSADVPRCQDITSEGKQVMCLREKQLGHGWACLDIVSEKKTGTF